MLYFFFFHMTLAASIVERPWWSLSSKSNLPWKQLSHNVASCAALLGPAVHYNHWSKRNFVSGIFRAWPPTKLCLSHLHCKLSSLAQDTSLPIKHKNEVLTCGIPTVFFFYFYSLGSVKTVDALSEVRKWASANLNLHSVCIKQKPLKPQWAIPSQTVHLSISVVYYPWFTPKETVNTAKNVWMIICTGKHFSVCVSIYLLIAEFMGWFLVYKGMPTY